MKKRLLMGIVALAASLAFVSAGIAQQKPAPTAPAQKPMWEKARGVIEKVDEAKKEVLVQGEKEKMSFSVGEQTKISQDSTKLTLSDLKKGMPVTVEFKKEGNMMLATWIDVAKKAEAKKEASAPMETKKMSPSEKATGEK
jgi:Cu/Ag efflux protein CusF